MDFSIVIAHRGNPMGLWATIHSCEIELANSNYQYEYRICTNGESPVDPDTQNCLHELQNGAYSKKRLTFIHNSDEPLSPPTARQIAANGASGKRLYFFDNHCLVGRDYFKRAEYDFETYGMDMLHSTTMYYSGGAPNYHYRLSLDKNFWTDAAATVPEHSYKPYPIAMGGHGGFAVTRSVFEEVGGYWAGLVGYGGEEPYFDLKMAMLDKTNYLDPLLVHYHFAGKRGYHRHFSNDFYRNMMSVANVIGGEPWMYKVYENFTKATKLTSTKSMYDLLMDAQAVSTHRKLEFEKQRKRTLEEQLRLFRENNIAH